MIFHHHWLLLLTSTLFIPEAIPKRLERKDELNTITNTVDTNLPDLLLNSNVSEVTPQNVIAIAVSPKPVKVLQQGKPTGVAVNKPVAGLLPSGSATTVGENAIPLGKTGAPATSVFTNPTEGKKMEQTETKIPKVKGKPVPVTRQDFPQSQPSTYNTVGGPNALDKVATSDSQPTEYGDGTTVSAQLVPLGKSKPQTASLSMNAPSGEPNRKRIPRIQGKPVPLTRQELPVVLPATDNSKTPTAFNNPQMMETSRQDLQNES